MLDWVSDILVNMELDGVAITTGGPPVGVGPGGGVNGPNDNGIVID